MMNTETTYEDIERRIHEILEADEHVNSVYVRVESQKGIIICAKARKRD